MIFKSKKTQEKRIIVQKSSLKAKLEPIKPIQRFIWTIQIK